MKQLTLGSLFDGIGGFPLAARSLGIRTLWTSEIEPNCREITARHFPDAVQLGDVTQISGAEIPPVDIISFGSPCQDLSVAGRREGLNGNRSGLFLEAVRIIYEMRGKTNGSYPTYVIWENVPGAYSSNGGADFRRVLQEITKANVPMPKSGRWAESGMVGVDGVKVAWRTFDAQYWGVPQRRKRIYLVGSFGDKRPEEILFKPESLLGYSSESGTAEEGTAADLKGCAYSAGFLSRNGGNARGIGFEDETSPCLMAGITPDIVAAFNGQNSITAANVDYSQDTAPTLRTTIVPNCLQGVFEMTHADEVIRKAKDGVCPMLQARMGTGGNQVPLVVDQKTNTAFRISSLSSNAMRSDNPYSGIQETEVSKTLDVKCCNPTCNQGGVCIVSAYAIGNGQRDNTGLHEIPGALNCMHDQQAVLTIDRAAFNQGKNAKYNFEISDKGVASTLVAKGPSAVCYRFLVRRLTPTECERLQAFPDDWTKYRADGSEIKDAPRYTALGNSIAVPCAVRVFKGILDVERRRQNEE